MWPIIYESKNFSLYSYPLFWGLAWGLGIQSVWDFFSQLKIKAITKFFWIIGLFLFAWFGAKIFYLLTTPQKLTSEMYQTFWYGGGFVFYGGLIGSLIYIFLISTLVPKFHWKKLDYLILILLPCHALGRIGCFISGCCFGKEISHWHMRFPTQLFEALFLFSLWFILKKHNRIQFHLSYYFIGYGLFRFFIEFLRGDLIRGEWLFLTPSQWISLFLVSIGILLFPFKKNNSQI